MYNSKCFLGMLVSMAVATAHGAENAQVADCVKGPVHAREFIIRDSSGQYSELKPMLGNSFGERLELWGVVDKQTNARTGVEYTLRLERPDIKEKIYVRGDKALLDQVCNRKIWMVGYESVSEISPFEQNWMYEMFVIPVRMQCGYGYKRFFKLVQILNSEPQTRQQKADSGVSVFRPLLARGFGEPAYATGILCRRDCQGENRYYIDFRFPRLGTQGGKEIQVVFEFGDGGCYPPQPDPDFHRPKGRPMEAMKIDLDSLCGKCLSFVGIESIVQERDPSWVKGDAAATNTGLIRRYTVVSLPNIIDYADSEWYFIK